MERNKNFTVSAQRPNTVVDKLNNMSYTFYPALSDEEVYLMNLDEWEHVTKDEEDES